MSGFVTGIGVTAKALADPTRQRIVDLLVGAPLRTNELAASTGMSAAALIRHLNVLRDAELVERVDVVDDGRGRQYRLRPAGLRAYAGWVSDTWAAMLSRGRAPDAAGLLARMGSFLDAFATGDVEFFRTHLDDDVLLVFPGMPAPIGRQECLDSVADHPSWQRYEIDPDPDVRDLGTHSLICSVGTVQHDHDPSPRRVAISALFAETDPWKLAHLQWTSAAPDEETPP